MAYTKPKQRKKDESKRQSGDRDQIKSIDLIFETWQVVGFGKGRRSKEKKCGELQRGIRKTISENDCYQIPKG